MAPSPRKQPTEGSRTPRKIAQSTPTKKTRTSPRKKAWASPPKAISSKLNSELFNEEDFANISNRSWAEITEEDQELNDSFRRECEKSESRRKGVPRRLNATQTKPKFVKSLELTNQVFVATSTRKSTRISKIAGKSETVTTTTTIEETKSNSNQYSRKRCLSNASTINEITSPTKRRQTESASGKPVRKTARGRLLDESSSRSVSGSPSRKEGWEEPTLGWCTDEATLKRRTREIERAKEKTAYQKYITEIPFRDRIKGVHPRTPNKLINYSRRSWDTQIKKWKRSLYDWAGEEPSDSVNTSFCSYNSDDAMSGKEDDKDLENTPVLRDLDIPVRPEADNMASLLGKFDIDSQMGINEESTLKAINPKTDPKAPVDFSHAVV
ncbi:unnamed protein product [Caenorhabditis bovis]|uniref:Histone RNA hairpin-binding protein RNA-binding domain-containing protein n=1 Tax=Caenorhabditis bovis TaxID=2654633 RepID=A0A8S1EWR9_9PELO|nr:unnamed protein product [Caenorhabditis bovis]